MMEELEGILREHAKRYPCMEPTDGVKLIYQNEFGGGHLIRDEEACLNYLRREYETVGKDGTVPRWEAIGNGLVRMNLAAVPAEELEELGRDFIRSAASHQGRLEIFLRKLDVLRKLTGEGIFAFGLETLDLYLEEYRKAGYPMVSHSQTYRDLYRPAYRVVLLDLAGPKT